jgi:membrane protease YdiL (CAAX protease family)
MDRPDTPSESVLRLLAFAIGWSLLAMAPALLAAIIAGAFKFSTESPDFPQDVGRPIRELAIIGGYGIWFFGIYIRGRAVGNGLVHRGLGYEPIARGLLIVIMAILIATYAVLLNLRLYLIRPDLLSKELTMAAAAPWLSLYAALKEVVFDPLAEDLFFRGWLWTGLRKRWGATSTAVFTGALWLALHASAKIYILAMIFPVAVILSVARHFGGSVRASIALHILYNAAVMLSPWAFRLFGLP